MALSVGVESLCKISKVAAQGFLWKAEASTGRERSIPFSSSGEIKSCEALFKLQSLSEVALNFFGDGGAKLVDGS